MKNNKSIFETERLWKLNFKVVLPSLMLTLLFGIYVFVDQILMQQIIPNNNINFFYNDFLSKNLSNSELIIVFKNLFPHNDSLGNIINTNLYDDSGNIILNKALKQANADVIYLSVTTIGAINLIFLSIGFFINTGASVLYSRSLAKNNLNNSKHIWVCSFYGCLISSIFIVAIMLTSQQQILKMCVASPYDAANGYIEDKNYSLMLEYFILRNKAVIFYSNNYTFFITLSIPFLLILNLLIFFIRAEGKNCMITVLGLVSNALNILFDFLLFKYAKLNIMGGAIATFIGYFINFVLIIFYTLYLEKNKLINFSFQDLKKIKLEINIYITSFILSLGTFLRDLSLAVANIIYIPIFSSTMAFLIQSGVMNQEELNDIFAISATPLYNLFFFALYGIIDGMRPIIAYNYQKENYRKVKQSYYSGMFLGIIFAIIVNIILFSSLNDDLLIFFNATTTSRKQTLILLLYSMMFQLPFVAISISGLSLFQANGKMLMTTVLSLFQGLICFIPTLFTMSELAKILLDKNVMIFAGFTNIVISSILIEIISEIYLNLYMGKKEKNNNPLYQIDKIINYFNKNQKLINSNSENTQNKAKKIH